MKRDIAQEIVKMVQETIADANLDAKSQDLQDQLVDYCLRLVKSKLSREDAYDAKEFLLRQEQASLRELRQKARAAKKSSSEVGQSKANQ